MRRKTVVISALILVFALMLTACAVRRPLQTPLQPGRNTGLNYNYNGTGTGTGIDTGIGPFSPYPNNRGFGINGTGNPTNFGGFGGSNFGIGGNNFRNIGGTSNSPNYGVGTGTAQFDGLARACEAIPGVDRATVVVSGNTAYVGVNSNGGVTGRNVANRTANDLTGIRRQCAQKIRAADPRINTVYVSEDANFFERLRRVESGMRNGTSIDSFRNELNGLVRSLTPERL
ncbi:MAG TPA: YhcN/YlaJ family sporulation lipoprotein [Bacillota bacterium]|nr:YhcN/YlaJ family sporulation lipoprotein [Bacillota bacterium]